MSTLVASRRDLDAVVGLRISRGRPRVLTREAVVANALDVVQADGLAGLTMRRLAKDLGVSVSSVHKTVGSKDDLLQALADVVLAELPRPEVDLDDPVGSLVDYLLEVHLQLLRHPAVAQLSMIAPMHNPSLYRLQEMVIGLLREAGLSERMTASAYSVVTSYLFGYTLTRITREEFDRRAVIAMLPADEFPGLHAVAPHFAARTADEQLRDGLTHIILGFIADTET